MESKNEVQILVDRMLDSLPSGFTPSEIRTSYTHRRKLGKEYKGMKVSCSLGCPENSINII